MKRIDELDDYSCRAVLSHNAYCGLPKAAKSSWCPKHKKLYTKTPKIHNLDTSKPFDNYTVSQKEANKIRGFGRKTR